MTDGARSHTHPEDPATVDADGNPVLSECGQTQVCVCGEDGEAVWSHPIDVHYITTSLSGWPSLLVEVWAQDSGGRNEIAGYGMAHLPSAPGRYEMDVPLWRPVDIRSTDKQPRFLSSPLSYISQSISAVGKRELCGHNIGLASQLVAGLAPCVGLPGHRRIASARCSGHVLLADSLSR